MWLIIAITFLSTKVNSSCCVSCALVIASQCATCDIGYYSESGICVQQCGQGYMAVLGSCILSGYSLTLVNTNFASGTRFTDIFIGDFHTMNLLNFLDPSNLVPTKDIGFYAAATST